MSHNRYITTDKSFDCTDARVGLSSYYWKAAHKSNGSSLKMSTNYRKSNEMSLALFIGLSGVNQKSNDYRCERLQTHFVCLLVCFLPSTLLELAHP